MTKKQIPFKDAATAINKATKEFLGILGLSKAGIIILEERYKNNKGIIRVNNKEVNNVKAALTLTKNIRSLGVSGILQNAYKKYIEV